MAVTPDTEIRLVKCNLNLDNNNQLNFASKTAQYNYFNSLTHLTITGASYQRKDDYIRYPAHIDTLIEYNYVMYKNTHYKDKWFYAYITKMEYEDDGCTRVYIKTDVWQTWQFDLTFMKSFVEREHVNSDNVGEHTVPESLETGEYIINTTDYVMFDTNRYVVIAVSSTYNTPFSKPAQTTYNGIFSGEYLYTFGTTAQARNFINIYDECGQADAINSVYMIPGTLYNKLDLTSDTVTYTGSSSSITCTYSLINGTSGTTIEYQKVVSMQTTLNGYTPKNNKVKCYPYNFLQVDNNNGASAIYHYEKFVSNSPSFRAVGAITPGCSVMLYPLNYNLISDDLTHDVLQCSYSEGIPLGKYPVGSWNTDVYTNWLTQTSANRSIGLISNTVSSIGSAVMGNSIGAVSGVAGIFNAAAEVYQHTLIPDQTRGNTNSGDVTYAYLQTAFSIKKKSIKQEYAKIIDDFFTMYGYKVNTLKVPNITGRSNWNYVKLINPNIEGYIPQEDLQEVKQMFSDGITIWHTTSHFLDYSQTNSII